MSSRKFYENESWANIANKLSPAIKSYLEDEKKFIIENLKNSSNVLDVGCGDGRIIDGLLSLSLKSMKIFGIDISKDSVALCKKKFAGISNVSVSLQDAIKTNFTDSSIDAAVIGFNFLGNLDNEEKSKFLNESKRFLKKNQNF